MRHTDSSRGTRWGGRLGQGHMLGDKSGRYVALTLSPSCADCLEIWEPQPPEHQGPVDVADATAFLQGRFSIDNK